MTYSDRVHARHAGKPSEVAGKILQSRAYLPHLGWGFYADDFMEALQAYVKAGGKIPTNHPLSKGASSDEAGHPHRRADPGGARRS